ncbi:uncharacterized protein RJT21DRAFT_8433 [Scheffersomyces amazonensis]|uniref:uncharacterized protein n=1 Tax=Scheffersomyces amazonensis TaxID=1078765 RepID=UPI00315CFB15
MSDSSSNQLKQELHDDESLQRSNSGTDVTVESDNQSRGNKRTIDDANDDDDDEENQHQDEEQEDEDGDEQEDDEDDDDEEVPNRKRKRRRANQFIDIEAEVDDEEEDELDEDDEEAELLREQFISDDRAADVNEEDQQDDRLHRQFDRRRQEAEDQDAEQLAETLKQRYRRTHTVYRGDTTTSGTVSQKLLMPSINDPSIYAIRCTPGREKDLVRRLYDKKRTLERMNTPLDILTVFQRDSFRGYIYIEAKRPDAIDKALTGMVNVYVRDKLLVPVKEYPDLLKQVKSSDVEIVPGIYIRITRGKYKGDLAMVDNLSENGLDVRCKLVPRLDYGRNDEIDRDGKKIRSKLRPLPRLFSEQEARTYDSESFQPGRGPRNFIYKGDEYNEGFLYKDFKIQFIQTKDIHPTLEELDRFQNNDEDGIDLSAIAASLKNKNQSEGKSSTSFQPGDKVEIRRGELAKTIGLVVEASLNEITISVTDSGDPKFDNEKLTVPPSDLRKIFYEGDHVRVVEGKHFDETGLVIKVDGDSVVLVSDQTKEDVRVFANYLIKASDATSNMNSINSKYDIKDLVQLNVSSVGVIVRSERSFYQILTSDGRLIDVKPSGISSKLELSRREQVSTDKNGFTISVGDTVKEALGDKRREGVILHIYKNSLFISSKEIVENLGIFVTNRMNVTTVSTKDSMVSRNLGPDLNRMNPNLKVPSAISAVNSALQTRAGGRDKLLYRDVAVSRGAYKGLKGKVIEADDIYARVELHTKSKKIKVEKQGLHVLDRGEWVPYLKFIGAAVDTQRDFNKPRAPAFTSGDRSTWNGGTTPAVGAGAASTWGGETSSWAGGKTPAYGSQSTWGGASAWGANNNNNNNGGGGSSGGNSAWGSKGGSSSWGSNSSTGGNSTWGKGGNSTWGSTNKGGNSTWGQGGNSTWGSTGGSSSWGSQNNKGNRSSWGK